MVAATTLYAISVEAPGRLSGASSVAPLVLRLRRAEADNGRPEAATTVSLSYNPDTRALHSAAQGGKAQDMHRYIVKPENVDEIVDEFQACNDDAAKRYLENQSLYGAFTLYRVVRVRKNKPRHELYEVGVYERR